MTDLHLGAKAPDLTFSTVSNSTKPMVSLEGSAFVLFFYPKAGTSGCTAEVVAFSERHADFAAMGIAVLGVSPDSPAKLERFRDKHGVVVALVSDEELRIAQGWGVWVEKSMYGRRYMGVERATFLVDAKGNVAEIWRKVKVNGHVDAVLETARRVIGG